MDETTHLFVEIEPGSGAWTITAPSLAGAPWVVDNPLDDARFLGEVRELREWASRPIVRGDPLAAGTRDYLDRLSGKVGERITTLLLTETARTALVDTLRRVAGGKVLLTIRVPDAGPLADAALALPWELLAPEPGAFALRTHSLQLIREVVTEGAPDLPAPDGPLAVAVMIAAPEDQTVIPYEEESFRLQLALSSLGHEVAFSDLGGLRDLVQLVEDRAATVIHFSGHGLPGKLLFENELGFAEDVAVEEVQRQLQQVLLNPGRGGSFPRLFFLSACFGAARGLVPDGSPSTAAALHRRGFAQVLGYFGPLDADLSSRAEETFYRALARGQTTLAAAEELRSTLDRPLGEGGERIYPLAWSQLAVYHRGPDLPLARLGAASADTAERPRRRMIQVSGLPVLEQGFIGRRGLQHEILRRARGGQRLIVLQGLGGLGKTALASHLVARVFAPQEPADQLILRCRELDDSADPILDLHAQAEEHGRVHGFPGWDERMKDLRQRIANPAAGFAAVIRDIRKERRNLVVYADNAESLQTGPTTDDARELGSWRPGAEAWWEQMEKLAEEGILVLASTRYGWEGLDVRAHCGIGPMSPADTLRLAASFEQLERLPQEVRRKLAQQVDGHPRTIEFLDRLVGISVSQSSSGNAGGASWHQVIEPLLGEKKRLIDLDLLLPILWRRISWKSRLHARRLNILRLPARHQVIDRLGSSRDELIRSGILTRHRIGIRSQKTLTWLDTWGLHSLVRDFLEEIPAKSRASAHLKAGAAYREHTEREDGTWSDCEEAIYHFFAINRANQIWPLTERYVIRLRNVGRYREALELLERCESCGASGDQMAKALTLMVQIRIGLGERSTDLNHLIERSLALATNQRSRRLILHESGSLLYQQAMYSEAEAVIRQALALAEGFPDEDNLTLGASLRMLANIYEKQGRFSDAEELLEGVLDRLARSPGMADPAYGASLFSLAQCLERHGKYSQAEEALRQVVTLFESSLGEMHHQYGLALHALANILLNRGEYTEAESLLRRSLSIYAAALGSEHLDYGLILRTLSEVLLGQGKLEEAESMLRDSLNLGRGILGARHPDFITTLHTLAHVREAQGRYSEAEQLFREALHLDEEVRRDDYVSLTSSLIGLGSCLVSQGKIEEAVKSLDRAVELGASFLGETHPFYGSALQALAGALAKQAKLERAESSIRQALAVKEASLGIRHVGYSSALVVLAQILEQQGRYEAAETVLCEAATIQYETLGGEHPERGSLLHSLGVIQAQQGKYNQAEAAFRESLRIAESSLGEEHPVVYPTLTSLAITLADLGRAAEGEPYLLRALAVVERVHERNHPDHAEVLSALAQLQFALRRPTALSLSRQALKELEGIPNLIGDALASAAVANLRIIIEAGLSEIRDLAEEAKNLAVASLKSGQGALRETLAARLEEVARQAAEGEEGDSPWLELEDYLRCVIAALRGEASPAIVPAMFSDHWQAIQTAANPEVTTELPPGSHGH